VIRFWNNEVFENLDYVLQTIGRACGGATPPMR
jgi:very-short-patch-repair endonuclease